MHSCDHLYCNSVAPLIPPAALQPHHRYPVSPKQVISNCSGIPSQGIFPPGPKTTPSLLPRQFEYRSTGPAVAEASSQVPITARWMSRRPVQPSPSLPGEWWQFVLHDAIEPTTHTSLATSLLLRHHSFTRAHSPCCTILSPFLRDTVQPITPNATWLGATALAQRRCLHVLPFPRHSNHSPWKVMLANCSGRIFPGAHIHLTHDNKQCSRTSSLF